MREQSKPGCRFRDGVAFRRVATLAGASHLILKCDVSRHTRQWRIPSESGVARISGITWVPRVAWIPAVRPAAERIESIVFQDCPKVLSLRSDYIPVAPRQPADPFALRIENMLAHAMSDPVSRRIEEVLSFHLWEANTWLQEGVIRLSFLLVLAYDVGYQTWLLMIESASSRALTDRPCPDRGRYRYTQLDFIAPLFPNGAPYRRRCSVLN
jgi:hypothetical protein